MGHATFASSAVRFARLDHAPARRATYLAPLLKLHRDCRDGSLDAVLGVVSGVALDLRSMGTLKAPFAAAEAAIAPGVHRGSDCGGQADAIDHEISARLHLSGSLYSGVVRFSPTLTAEVALALIKHSLLPGKVHLVYALKAYSCQQAIFMGPALGRRYRNSSLGAFVELTSRSGVGHGKYDANRVDRARITPLGRVGGQPCT